MPTREEQATPLTRIAFAAEIRRLVEPLLDDHRLLVEEPGVGLLLPVWMEALSTLRCRIACILVVRRPHEVAACLAVYDGVSVEEGLMLWLRYVLDAERETRGVPRVIVMHHEALRDPRSVLDRICGDLLLTGRLAGGDAECTLPAADEPADEPQGALADLCRQAWTALSTLATDGADSKAQTTLDRIDRAYREAAGLFGSVLAAARGAVSESGRRQRETVEMVDRRIRRYEEVAAERDARIAALTTEAARWREQANVLASTCASAEEELVGLRAGREAMSQEIGQLRATLRAETDEAPQQAAEQLRVLLAAERYDMEMEREQTRRLHQQYEAHAVAEMRRLQSEQDAVAAELAETRSGLITTIAELRWHERLSRRRWEAEVEELRRSVADLTQRLEDAANDLAHARSETEQSRHETAATAAELAAASADLAAKTAELRSIHGSRLWRLSHPFQRREQKPVP
ncbi:hypothetical protein [Methylobacterium tarhaniae]|uniref:hypothetical protein n=1 Tax=Methylobacterium tarhaniae TaxID=1187852 RepID=UPI003D091894